MYCRVLLLPNVKNKNSMLDSMCYVMLCMSCNQLCIYLFYELKPEICECEFMPVLYLYCGVHFDLINSCFSCKFDVISRNNIRTLDLELKEDKGLGSLNLKVKCGVANPPASKRTRKWGVTIESLKVVHYWWFELYVNEFVFRQDRHYRSD